MPDIQDPVELQFANNVVSHMFKQASTEHQREILDTIDSLTNPLGDSLMTIAESLKQDGIRENQIQMVINRV